MRTSTSRDITQWAMDCSSTCSVFVLIPVASGSGWNSRAESPILIVFLRMAAPVSIQVAEFHAPKVLPACLFTARRRGGLFVAVAASADLPRRHAASEQCLPDGGDTLLAEGDVVLPAAQMIRIPYQRHHYSPIGFEFFGVALDDRTPGIIDVDGAQGKIDAVFEIQGRDDLGRLALRVSRFRQGCQSIL